MKNMRTHERGPIHHEDFEYVKGSPTLLHYNSGDKNHRSKISKIRNGYFDFAICWWGDLGRIVEIGEEKGGNYLLIKDLTKDKSVRKTMENIDWHDTLMICTGAPQLTLEMFIEIYDNHRSVSP